MSQSTNSGKEGWAQSSGRVTSWEEGTVSCPPSPSSHLLLEHALVLATLQDVLGELDLDLLAAPPLLDLLLDPE